MSSAKRQDRGHLCGQWHAVSFWRAGNVPFLDLFSGFPGYLLMSIFSTVCGYFTQCSVMITLILKREKFEQKRYT